MSGTLETLRGWVPVLVLAGGIIASGAVDSWRIGANAEDISDLEVDFNKEIDDLEESIDSNELSIEEIQRLLIRRQGEVALELQRIQTEQSSQGARLDQIIRLLEAQR